MSTGAVVLLAQGALGKPVDLPMMVPNHPGPEACVGFMEGRWVAKRPAHEKMIEEWSAAGTKQHYKGDYTCTRELWRRGKLVSSLTMYVRGGRFGSHVVIPKTMPYDHDETAMIEPLWGRGDEKSYVTEISTNDGKRYTYTQFDTNRLTLTIDDMRNKTSEMIEFKRIGKPRHVVSQRAI
ncbi:MAG: hypothetical protein EKK48_10220 [Candidatus Melainabacteria bacterium]|nr:MAG: hypothetical protein EKK48_10220 [Candidatus Melainabacteria bacterium]